MSDLELEKLIAAWLDGRLDAEGSQALQQALRESAAARRKFREYTCLDVSLHELADTSGILHAARLVADDAERSQRQDDGIGASGLRVPGKTISPKTRTGADDALYFGRVASWIVAVAVLLVVTIYSFHFRPDEPPVAPTEVAKQPANGEGSAAAQEAVAVGEAAVADTEVAQDEGVRSLSGHKPPAPVATLALAKEARWKNQQPKVGEAFVEGQTVELEAGEVRISVGFGAELVVSSPCSLTFLASDRVRLNDGNVAVDVAPWAKGFTIVTEDMDVVDLGTTFTVSTSPGVKSETTVLKGVVRVHPAKLQNEQPRGLLVTEGEQLSVDDKGALKNSAQTEAGKLLSALDFGAAGPYRPVKLMNTGFGLAVGDEDMHWRVIAGPKDSFKGPEFATVCAPHERYLPNYPEASQWISIANWEQTPAHSVYTFQAKFNLRGYDLSTMQLFGRFLADNGIAAVRVNGESVPVQSWVDNVKYQPFGDPQFRFVNITKGLVQGRNIVEVDVRNGMMRKGKTADPPLQPIPNPMALRVEWYAFGRQHGLAKDEDGAGLLRLTHEEDTFVLTGSRPVR